MKNYSFLALTDHRGHSKENSLYALVATLARHPQCQRIDVASRGTIDNIAFFKDRTSTKISVCQVNKHFSFQENGLNFSENLHQVTLEDYDVIFMRLARPVSDDFLDFVAQKAKHKVIINHPLGIKKTSSKAFLLNFPEHCPPIQLCHTIDAILEFAQQFPIVLKPLREYGGKGIVKIDGNYAFEGNQKHDLHTYLQGIVSEISSEGYLAMKFMENVDQGDKRIIVVNGQILAASLRLPAKDSWLCNVAQGGTSIIAEVTPEEEAIIQAISPRLLEEGIVIFGADTLVNDDGKRILSEINTLSIGGFPQAEQQSGKPILQQTIDAIFETVNQHYEG